MVKPHTPEAIPVQIVHSHTHCSKIYLRKAKLSRGQLHPGSNGQAVVSGRESRAQSISLQAPTHLQVFPSENSLKKTPTMLPNEMRTNRGFFSTLTQETSHA